MIAPPELKFRTVFMSPLQRMTRSRNGWKMKATQRATELREQRKEILKARDRHKEDKERIRELEAQNTASPPPFFPNLGTSSD